MSATTTVQIPVDALVQNLAGAKRALDAARAAHKQARMDWDKLTSSVGITNSQGGGAPSVPPSPFPDFNGPAATLAAAVQQEQIGLQNYETARSAHTAYLRAKGAI